MVGERAAVLVLAQAVELDPYRYCAGFPDRWPARQGIDDIVLIRVATDVQTPADLALDPLGSAVKRPIVAIAAEAPLRRPSTRAITVEYFSFLHIVILLREKRTLEQHQDDSSP